MPGKQIGPRLRSVHDVGSMVAPIYRPEALYGACAARRVGIRRNDRPPGAHGRCAARVAHESGWRIVNSRRCRSCASPAMARHNEIPGSPPRAPDCVDVGSRDRAARRSVRACITSFRTTETDIHWVVSEMNRLAINDAQSSLSNRAAAPVELNG